MSNLSFRTVEQGSYSGEQNVKLVAITNKATWLRLWAQHTYTSFPAPQAPPVDFSKEMVIAVFAGTHSSGGYELTIEGIEETTDSITVLFKENRDVAGGFCSAAMSQPFHIVSAPTSSKPVVFKKDLGPAGRKVVLTDDHGNVIAEQG